MIEIPDLEKIADFAEARFGRSIGRFLVNAFTLSVLLGGTAFSISLVLSLTLDRLWPFAVALVDGGNEEISIYALLVTLLMLLVIVGTAAVIIGLLLAKSFARRVVPQSVIDQLAEYRSEGISILNDVPSDVSALPTWKKKWGEWGNEVTAYLLKNLTKADSLTFRRLGFWNGSQFSIAINAEHQHYLMQLAEQLTRLENLIASYQERI